MSSMLEQHENTKDHTEFLLIWFTLDQGLLQGIIAKKHVKHSESQKMLDIFP
jgi:hypothetical protein